MKVLKIFLNPDGQNFVYFGAGEGFHMGAWYTAMRQDGAALAQGALVPFASIHHVRLEDMPEAPTNLYSIPGGKPN